MLPPPGRKVWVVTAAALAVVALLTIGRSRLELAAAPAALTTEQMRSCVARLAALRILEPTDITARLSLVEHAHAVLVFGPMLDLTNTGIEGAPFAGAPRLYWNWLLGEYQDLPRPPEWLAESSGRLRLLRRERMLGGVNGESHPGELLFYACDGFVGATAEPPAVVALSGPLLAQVVAALGSDLVAGGDNDYSIPVLLRLSEAAVWERRFGDVVDIDSLVRAELDADPLLRPCFGLHWATCLSLVAHGGSSRVEDGLRESARTVAEHAASVLTQCTSPDRVELPWGVWLRRDLTEDAWVVLCTHAIEFLATHDRSGMWVLSPAGKGLTEALLSVPAANWTELPFHIRCHAASAANRTIDAMRRVSSHAPVPPSG